MSLNLLLDCFYYCHLNFKVKLLLDGPLQQVTVVNKVYKGDMHKIKKDAALLYLHYNQYSPFFKKKLFDNNVTLSG